MTSQFAVDLTRVALVMNFLSFFLVAPEIIGEERLQRWVADATGWLIGYSVGMLGAGVSFFAIAIAVTAAYWTNSPITAVVTPFVPVAMIFIVPLLVFVLIYNATQPRFATRLVNYLASNSNRRRLFFRAGLAMFVISTAIQFIVG